MTASLPPAPVDVIPAAPQRVWGVPAVLNFALGGLGAGFYLVAAVAARFEAGPVLGAAAWIGPLLVLAGFLAVAAEAGRPLRGPRVLARVGSSWMSREALLGGAFVLAAALEFVAPAPWLRGLAAALALAFAGAQGLVLRCARGVTAWSVGVMPAVIAVSTLLSGLGLVLAAGAGLGRPAGGGLLGATLLLLALALIVWLSYLTWSSDPAFLAATRPLRQGAGGAVLVGAGYVAPFALVALAQALGDRTGAAALAAGALIAAGQVHAKWLVILVAGELRPVRFAALSLHRRPS